MNKYLRGTPNYDKTPFVQISQNGDDIFNGWDQITEALYARIGFIDTASPVIAIECYHGVADSIILNRLKAILPGYYVATADFYKTEAEIKEMVYPDVTGDEVFGFITRLTIDDYFDKEKLKYSSTQINFLKKHKKPVIIYGPGASLLYQDIDLLLYFDMARWEIQLRMRRNEIGNLGMNNHKQKTSLQYKQAYFVDWRICDRHKKNLFSKIDYIVDVNSSEEPKMLSYTKYRQAMELTAQRPFRVVPFFDPGPWGGQWMKEFCDLDKATTNYAWCFDCVPEENSLLLKFGKVTFETPAINLVFLESKKLLGPPVQARFGDEFPIRFDFLDTMGGGNLSLQVHPTTDYIRENFGMQYTQDESYYILDAGPDATVFLGTKDETDPAAMIAALNKAQDEGKAFAAEQFVNKWPVKKHDHILIPAGTIHCSGTNSMVLEISATPYIFTFKLYDWGRLGLDGKPRPINIKHGEAVIDWTRTTAFTREQLINTFVPMAAGGDGYTETKTGLHEREFIETRVHDFSGIVTHHTNGSVNVLNLVDGREAIVESPDNSFEPFVVHYAETFIIPEAVNTYTIRPHGESEGQVCKTIKAFVRTHA